MKTLVRLLARLALFLLIAAALVFALAWYRSEQARQRRYDIPMLSWAATASAPQVERGKHLAETRGCTGCHGEDLAGKHLIDAGPVMQVHTPNLTPGGLPAGYDIGQFEHAVRHAVGREGRALMLMPSEDYVALSNDDLAALFAYLRQVPAMNQVQPPSSIGPLGRVLYLFGQLPAWKAESIDHAQASRGDPAPPAANDAAYGEYVARGCVGCHGESFVGGHVPGTPPEFKPAANLTPHVSGLGTWSEADFLRAMREGKRPDGSAIDPFMPWRDLARLDDTELRALWTYLRTLPAKPPAPR